MTEIHIRIHTVEKDTEENTTTTIVVIQHVMQFPGFN